MNPSSPLRIAFFSDSMLPVINGVSVSIDTLVTELRSAGHSVHFFGPGFPGVPENDPNIHRFRAIETPWSKGYPLAIPPFYPMLQTFRRYTFDIIHTHTPFVCGFVGLRWAESHEIPIVSTYHTLYDRYAHYLPLVPRRYSRFRIAKHTNFYYNSVAHVITPTETSLKWLRRHAVDTPATVIPTSTALARPVDRGEARRRLGVLPDSKMLLFVGRLAKEKNLECLLQAFAIARAQLPSLRLFVVGDGPHREALTALSRRLEIGDGVRFVGALPRLEVDEYYAAADLFTFASITETQGLVLQEAMHYGVPAMAVIGGGASEAIVEGVNGLLVKNEPTDFASNLVRLLSDEATLDRMRIGARQTVAGLTESSMSARVLAVYREVLENNRR